MTPGRFGWALFIRNYIQHRILVHTIAAVEVYPNDFARFRDHMSPGQWGHLGLSWSDKRFQFSPAKVLSIACLVVFCLIQDHWTHSRFVSTFAVFFQQPRPYGIVFLPSILQLVFSSPSRTSQYVAAGNYSPSYCGYFHVLLQSREYSYCSRMHNNSPCLVFLFIGLCSFYGRVSRRVSRRVSSLWMTLRCINTYPGQSVICRFDNDRCVIRTSHELNSKEDP